MNRSTALALVVTIPGVASASTWQLDPAHSSAQFAVKHLMISNVRGEFTKLSGTVILDERDPSKSKVEASIDASSLTTGDDKRDAHLASADFFDVAKFPVLTFKSKRVKPAGQDKLEVLGDLTMHGVTREVTLAVEALSAEVKDPWGNIKRAVVATTQVNRKDFGLTWNVVLDSGGVLVGEQVKITLELQMAKQAEATAVAQ